MKYIDVYSSSTRSNFFRLIHVMMKFKTFGSFWTVLLQILFFLQIIMITINNISGSSDYTITLLKYISNLLLIQEYLATERFYTLTILIASILILLIIFDYIYIQISINLDKFYIRIPVSLLNYFNLLLRDYLIGPIMIICLISTKCDEDNKHLILKNECYKDLKHLLIFIFSIINFVFYFGYSIMMTIYYNEIGAVNENKLSARTNCNYEFYIQIFKNILFVLSYYQQYYKPNSSLMQLIIEIYVCVFCLLLCIYCYYQVLIYNNLINNLNLYGCSFISWFAFILIMKDLLNLKETSVFHILGWILISIILFLLEDDRKEYLLTDFNIFDASSLKEIEIFIQQLYNLISVNSIKNKTTLVGIIEKFETYFIGNFELNQKYTKLHQDEIVSKKITNKLELKVLSIVFLIYEYYLKKDELKNDILLIMSYFLINKFKKSTLAIYYCSKISVDTHKFLYLKYILMEEIKDYLVFKITKATDMDSMSHIQISSMILYYIYADLFKIKIYDAACSQIDYFEHLTNFNIDSNITQNFLNTGDDILQLRKKILKLWEKIFELNPFCEDCENNYYIYLQTILQDEELVKSESKKINMIQNNKSSERTNIYYSLFLKEQSSILLVDGYSDLGKILYVSSNFENVFDYKNNELVMGKIENILPKTIASFHSELVNSCINFSRLEKVFKKPINTSLKGKRDGLFSIELYVKPVPNFKFGLIYFSYLKKVNTNTFNILLDRNLKISHYTDLLRDGNNSLIVQYFGLKPHLNNRNICVFIPELLKMIQYKNGEFSFMKNDLDLEANFYPVVNLNEVEEKVDVILQKIKSVGFLHLNDDAQDQETLKEYDELMFTIRKRYPKGTNIFYKITTKIFLKKYSYHLFQMSNDLIKFNNKNTVEGSPKLNQTPRDKKERKESQNMNSNDTPQKKSSGTNKKPRNMIQLENEIIDGDADKYKEKEVVDEDDKKKPMKKNGTMQSKKMLKKNNPTIKSKKQENEEKKEDGEDDEDDSKIAVKNINMDISTFNKLKSHIIKGEEVSWMIIMKYVGLAFCISSMVFCYFFYKTQVGTMEKIKDYCDQNLVFNHSKISGVCTYVVLYNIYHLKKGVIEQNSCYAHNTCKDFYLNMLSLCLEDLEEQTQNITYFNQDFIDLFYKTIQANLTVYGASSSQHFNISKANLFMFILSTSFELASNIDSYFAESYSIYDCMDMNAATFALYLFNDESLKGFENVQIKKNLSGTLNNYDDFSFIIEVCLFFVFSIVSGILIFQVNKIEIEYIRALIRFNSQSFENYIKSLFELKQKIMDNTSDENNIEKNEEGDPLINEDDSEEIVDHKSKKKNQDNFGKIMRIETLNKADITKEGENTNKENEKKKNNKKAKIKNVGIKQLKVQAMSKYFKKMNIIFLIKVVVIFFMTLSYFFVLAILESHYNSKFLAFDYIVNEVEGTYKSGFENLITIKNIVSKMIEFEIKKNKTITTIMQDNSSIVNVYGISYTINNISSIKNQTLTNLQDPSKLNLVDFKLGNSIMNILNDESVDSDLQEELNQLYNGDSCRILFPKIEINETENDDEQYEYCSKFWSAILVKGMEQAMTQMVIEKNSVIDELTALYRGEKEVKDILSINSSFRNFELFLMYYFLKSFWKSSTLFDQIKLLRIRDINDVYLVIMIVYMAITFVLCFVVRAVIKKLRRVFNSFLNFIVILPAKFLGDDHYFLEEILKLEEKLY